MPFHCVLCHKEMPENCGPWQSFIFGVICENHNHKDVTKVVELTSAKVREALLDEITTKFRSQVIDILDKE